MSGSLPKISIVTPSFNQGRFIEKTILSVIEQEYPNLEYIIIDGGSTDESVEIIKKYEKHLAYWVSEPDRGQSHAINKGFERATGEIFGWLNSDDWYHPGALQAVAEAFAANPEAGAVVGAGEMVDEEGKQLLYKAPTKVDLDFLYHWLDDFFWQPSCFFTRNAYIKCGPIDENIHFSMDLDLWLKIAKQYNFSTTLSILSSSLRHDEAKTTAFSSNAIIDATIVIINNGGEKEIRSGLGAYLQDLNHQLIWRVKDIESLNQQIIDHQEHIHCLRNSIDEIINSLSWKITSPVRYVVDKLINYRDSNKY